MPERSDRRRATMAAAVLVGATLAAYLPAMNGAFVWDDDFHVTANPSLEDARGLLAIWTDLRATPQYYPLTHTTFWLQHRLWGEWTLPYHLLNVLLHACSAVVLWRILLALRVPGAWLGAALFALHPVHVESVAWITERKNVLSGLFYLAAAAVYLRWASVPRGAVGSRSSHGASRSPRERALPWIAMALFACALLSKTVTASLPLALGLVLWWKRRYSRVADTAVLGAMLLAGAAMGKLTSLLEQYQIGAVGEPWSLTIVERALIAGRAWWFYLGKLAWPAKLAFVYPRWEVDVTSPAQIAFPLAAVGALVVTFRLRERLGAGPWVALALFTVSVAPALGFFDVYPHRYSFVADHFQYLASIGPLALLAAAVAAPRGRAAAARQRQALRTAVGVAVLMVLGGLTFFQASAYRDPESLWRHSLARNPDAPMARFNLAVLLQGKGESGEPAALYREALEDEPELVDAHVNLANLLASEGRLDSAVEHYREALRIHPALATAHYNLALALEGRGERDQALRHYRHAIAIRPDFAEAHNNLAIVLYESGRYSEAWTAVQRSRELGLEPHADFVRALRRKIEGSAAAP